MVNRICQQKVMTLKVKKVVRRKRKKKSLISL